MRDREERKKNRRASSLSFFSTSNISPSRTCLTSTSCFLFVLVDLDSPQHCRSTLPLSSVPLVMTSPSMFHILNFCLFISHTFSPITKAILNKQSILFFSYLVYEKKLHTNYSEEKHLVVGMKSKENRMNFVRLLSQEVYFWHPPVFVPSTFQKKNATLFFVTRLISHYVAPPKQKNRQTDKIYIQCFIALKVKNNITKEIR